MTGRNCEVEIMNVAKPDLLTLVNWAERLAAGERCAPWEEWCATSSEAARKWARVIEAREFLASGEAETTEEPEISAEELAEFVEGHLEAADARRVEAACWRSIAQLAELLSTARFMNQSVGGEVPPQLESRLLALLPGKKSQNGREQPFLFRLEKGAGEEDAVQQETASAPAAIQRSPWIAGELPPAVQVPPALVALAPRAAEPRPLASAWLWSAAATALVLVVLLSGMLGYLAATLRQRGKLSPQPIAVSPEDRMVSPAPVEERPSTPMRAPDEKPQTPTPKESVPEVPPSAAVPAERGSESAVPVRTDERETPKVEPRRETPPGAPRFRPRVAPATPQLAVRTTQGVLLADAGERGVWHVAPANYSLIEPLKVMSLAESWTAAEAAGIGAFVWEGNAEAAVSALSDGTIEVRLVHGRMAVRDLQAGAQVRLLSGEAAWTVRGVARGSTVAVVSDPLSPGLVVSRGEVEADGLQLLGGQMTRWLEGGPQPPVSLSAATPTSSGQQVLTPPVMNPWDLAWLQPPDENAQKQWRQVNGKVVERLSAVEDVGTELPKLLAATREPRQAALLARWSLATGRGADKPRKTWDLLADRRAAVRVAGVKSIVELPPGDERLEEMGRFFVANLGAGLAERLNQWHAAAWQPGAPPQSQTEEIIGHLQHNDLAVRQIAESYLELFTAAALQQMGIAPPAYDATATDARRAAAQLQWRELIQQLYNPNRKFPGALTPRLQNALQNAQPGGT